MADNSDTCPLCLEPVTKWGCVIRTEVESRNPLVTASVGVECHGQPSRSEAEEQISELLEGDSRHLVIYQETLERAFIARARYREGDMSLRPLNENILRRRALEWVHEGD